MMNCSDHASKMAKSATGSVIRRRPRVLLAACGSVAAVRFGHVCRCFAEWAEVRAVLTKSALHFISVQTFPKEIPAFGDDHDWNTWKRIGDGVVHIALIKWAEILVIAPLSANTLGKIAGGLCDNLLTCIVRGWDYRKPLFVAPSMNSVMWKNPFTQRHCAAIRELGISFIPPAPHRAANGDIEHGAMAETSTIYSTVRRFYELTMQKME